MRTTGWGISFAVALVVGLGVPGSAQEVSLFGVAGHRRSGPDFYGVGASVVGFVRLGQIFGPDAGSLQYSNRKLGARLSVNDLRYTTTGDFSCSTICAAVQPVPKHVRFQMYELSLLMLPHETTVTRVELGGGFAGADRSIAVSGLLSASRRIRKGPIWVSAGWEPRKWFQAYLADGNMPLRPTHSWRFGLWYAIRDR